MKKKTLFILTLSLFLVLIFATGVAAQTGMFEQLFKPFGNIEEAYAKYSPFINMILYLIIFIGLAQWTLAKRFGGGGKAMIIGIGIIFAVSLALWEKSQNINLVLGMGPYAALVFLAILSLAVYQGLTNFKFLSEEKHNKLFAAIAAYFIFFSAASGLGIITLVSKRAPMIAGILSLAFLGCAIGLLVGAYILLKKKFGFGKGAGGKISEDILRIPPAGKIPGLEKPPEASSVPGVPPAETEKAKKDVGKAGKKVTKVVTREEKYVLLEENEIKKIFDTLNKLLVPLVKSVGRSDKDIEERIKIVGKNANELKSEIGKLNKGGVRATNFMSRAQNIAKRIEKDLEKIGEEQKAKVLTKDFNVALAYCIKLNDNIKEMRSDVTAIKNGINQVNQDKTNTGVYKNFFDRVTKICQMLRGRVTNADKYLKAIIVLDEQIKKIILEEEAKAKK